MAKKKNSRKALAVALGIMGIAGLSLASASQLNITTSDNLATGTQVFGSSCDDAVNVAYTSGGTATAPNYTGVDISGIATACATKKLSYTLNYSTWSGTAYVAATALSATDVTISGTTLNVPFTPVMSATNRLDSIAITIK